MRDLPLTAEQRRTFVGSYAVTLPHGERTSFAVFEENGQLEGRPANQDEARRLLYQGDDVFAAEGMPDFVLSFVVDARRATRFTVRPEGGVITGVRAP